MKRTHLLAVATALAAITILTSNAFARSRYLHPRLGRFTQRDPLGTANASPQSAMTRNTSSPTFTRPDPTPGAQYADGMNLYGYVQNGPMTHVDPSGMWKIRRDGKWKKALAFTEKGDTIRGLSKLVGFDPTQWKKWLSTLPNRKIAYYREDEVLVGYGISEASITLDGKLKGCLYFKIPNTVLAYWAGEVGPIGRWWVRWEIGGHHQYCSALRLQHVLVVLSNACFR